MQMPEENVIADARAKERSSVASQSSTLQRVGVFAGRYRWVICGLLFLGITKNYMDRQVLGVLKTPLQHELGWDDIQYGHLVTFFQMAYALGMLCMGRVIDWLGPRIGYAVAMVFWSLASMAHAAANYFKRLPLPARRSALVKLEFFRRVSRAWRSGSRKRNERWPRESSTREQASAQ